MKRQTDEEMSHFDFATSDPDANSASTSGENNIVASQVDSEMDLSNLDFDAFNDRLIITQIDDSIFENEEAKLQFEELFKRFDEEATFCYLKNFRRAQVCFHSIAAAVRSRIELNNYQIGTKKIQCYFAQKVPEPNLVTDPFLLPPKPTKQFLISPPPSPPEGWEPIEENGPSIDYDLLAALAHLAPGEAHELHPKSETQPGIVVHICEDLDGYRDPTKPKIEQTRHPSKS